MTIVELPSVGVVGLAFVAFLVGGAVILAQSMLARFRNANRHRNED